MELNYIIVIVSSALYTFLSIQNYRNAAIIVLIVLLLFSFRIIIELWKRNKQLKDQRDDDVYRELRRLTMRQTERDMEMASIARQQDEIVNNQVRTSGFDQRVMVVCIGGKDAQLEMDIIPIRQAWDVSEYIRVTPLTRVQFANAVLRQRTGRRGSDRAVKYLHFSVHSGHDGLLFDDGPVDARFLSEYLHDIECILINGCNSDVVADNLIGLADYIVSLSDEIAHAEATRFCGSFWGYVKDGLNIPVAFNEALRDVPRSVAEFTVLHRARQ